jgi:formylglycine-generating enzyme required for sulfatase activity
MHSADDLVLVPGGRFRMGSEQGRPDERPVHEVEVSPFFLARVPVTRSAYSPFLEAGRCEAPPWWSDPAFSEPDQPVVGVRWPEAVAFACWMAEVRGGCWRLPTEAEWERAARAGLDQAATTWGASLPPAEVPVGPLSGPWRVGRGTPNLFGLLDMGTIVHEWCLDWYAPRFYEASPVKDPQGPPEGERRSSRGGSWRHHVRWSPPSARSSLPPSSQYADYGFRLLREATEASGR